MMETIKLKTHIGNDGVLTLQLPPDMANRELEVLIVMQPAEEDVDELGWPVGFFDRTYGALADDPIERPPHLPLEERDEIE
jgi:hypothetical protein